ncbi:hypothetical protein QFZ81_003851 [Paenibacillus sp. V4I9]|uniref:DUF3221 domain-containing protein n=1 Tax=Paenibacillus sp. V4I9 TaxID=3042308 RepID=UPI0027839F14|nr:DUF3221 domain-containing protein [Paenibacillus sp. V4I9]MDQ0888763.1 hypothetical protein [Paenibacillus sp. V4I9]
MNKLIKWILPIVFVFLTAGCGEKAVVNEQLAEKVSEKPVNLLRLDDFKQVMQEEGTLLSSKGEGNHEMFILSGVKPSIFTASLMFHEEVNPKKNLYVYEFKSDEERKIGLEAFDQIKDIVKFSAQPQVTFQKNLAVIYWSDAPDLEPYDNVVTDPVGESVLYAMDRLGEPEIEGYIVDKKVGEILVVSSEAKDYSHGKGQEFYNAIWFSNVSDTLVIGDKVKVWAERGNYTAPYPGREIAHKVIEQSTVRPKGADRTEEYMLQRALQDEKLKTDMHKIIAVKSVNYNAKEDTWYLHFKDTIMLEDFYFKLDDK